MLGIVVLVFAYVLPAAIRSRQVVVDSRAADRYSGDLRIVATAGDRPEATASTGRVFVHARRPEQEAPMGSGYPADRQLAAADARRLAAARAARAAAASRRAAAARRRLVLTTALLLLTAGGWAAYAVLSWPLVAAVLPTLALLGAFVLGRRAAAAGAAADARWERELAAIKGQARDRAESAARATGRPRLRVDVDPTALIAEKDEARVPRSGSDAVERPGAWTPVPVPPPAYTLKQAAPRRQMSPLVMDAPTERMDPVVAEEPAAESEQAAQVAEATPAAEPAIDVQAVLAKRRAVG